MRRLRAGLPGSRVRLSPMPVYEGEDNWARHQLIRGRNCCAALSQLGKHVSLGVSLVARLNVASSVTHGAQTDSGTSQDVNHRYCKDCHHGSLDGAITEC
jgi:hypothetical protein